ncbi:hypothetical protein Ahy_B08g091439 isoform B [Arachis hypogaea]|uniref:Uncharacterized protein n=1 Tax=Arachis hypogaea TaxID=3818 RepID=A0A444Y2A9_ARAHY|nr:hypothetical protein Ahy_B08g091439 isoform B [Arachis hypogaea]
MPFAASSCQWRRCRLLSSVMPLPPSLLGGTTVTSSSRSTMSASYPEDVQSSEPRFTSATQSTVESVRSSGQSESMLPPQPQSQPQTQMQTQPPSLPPLPPHSD